MIILTNEYGEGLDKNGYSPSLFDTGKCYFCKRQDGKLDRHEVFHGSGRRERSKRYGCWITLCHTCHMMLHNGRMPDAETALKKECQKEAQSFYGWTTDEFILMFGKNYV